jgi:type IV pilus assembly protein PilC
MRPRTAKGVGKLRLPRKPPKKKKTVPAGGPSVKKPMFSSEPGINTGADAAGPKRSQRLDATAGDVKKKSLRPEWAQYEKGPKKGEVAESIRSLGIMLTSSRGETVPLATLAEQYKGTELGAAYGRIYQGVQSGQADLAEAFKAEEKLFPKIIGDLLVVGTRSGTSAVNLQKAADILDEGQDLTQKIKSAVMQPAILMGVIILFLYSVIFFILPVFADMFKSFGKPLPPMSQAIMTAGNVMAYGGAATVVLVVAWTVYYKAWGKNILSLRIRLGKMQFGIPVLGGVFRSQRLTQLFSILSGLLSVGMSERDALVTAAEASGNLAVRDHIQKHIIEMDRGTVDFADISDGFLIPLQAGFMLRNGFDSGAEVRALEDLTNMYRRDANKKAENLTQALEPIANGAVGLIFALVIVATYLPVYDMFLGMTEV